jgi:hypothetical protein
VRKRRTGLNRKIGNRTAVTKVAYLKKEKQTVEIDYPLNTVWAAIPEVLSSLEWKVEQMDDASHHTKVKTKPGFMLYSSNLSINGIIVNERTCRLTVEAETPITTITAITDFGRASDRIELFFETLANRLHTAKKS